MFLFSPDEAVKWSRLQADSRRPDANAGIPGSGSAPAARSADQRAVGEQRAPGPNIALSESYYVILTTSQCQYKN